MAIVKPFRAVRPAGDKAPAVAALPYDVYSQAEAYAAVQGHPLSFLNIDRAETQFGPDADPYAPEVYAKADEMIRDFLARGIFLREEKPCYYIYALTMNGRTQTGIVGCSSIDDYEGGIIKKHENTRAEKELDRINHVDVTSAQTGPIFLAYRSVRALEEIVAGITSEKPACDFVSEDEIRHQVWIVNDDETITALEKGLESLPATYIADGHHRAASAVKVGKKRREAHPGYTGREEFNFFLSVLFPDSQLMIMPYNRVVKDLNGLSVRELLREISEDFEVEELGMQAYTSGRVSPCAFAPAKKGDFGMYLDDTWYRLSAKEHILSDDPVSGLDVSVLQDHLLSKVLGIKDPRTDKRIDFIGGIRGLAELEKRVHEDMSIAFSMYPTSIGELFAVADAGLLMPPKSTWFEPKLRSGLFLHEIER